MKLCVPQMSGIKLKSLLFKDFRPIYYNSTPVIRGLLKLSTLLDKGESNEVYCIIQLWRYGWRTREIWLVGWFCFTYHRQRGHLETAPQFTVPCKGREDR